MFFAVCMGMVLAPRISPPSLLASAMASLSAPQSTPQWSQKRPSSPAITASGSSPEMSESGTQRRSSFMPLSRSAIITVVKGGLMKRKMTTRKTNGLEQDGRRHQDVPKPKEEPVSVGSAHARHGPI